MFSKLIKRNSKKYRTNNGLYFSSMIISIIAFYIILSLSHQDVMIFLQKMESDAVKKLFSLIQIFYVASLIILLFLVYYASSMQIEERKHEFGVYLTLGMPRYKLFWMLMLEDFRNNIIALGIGLPIAVLISELISLITAKIVGLGIIGHKFSLSFSGIIFTIIGFMLVKLFAFIILSAKIARKEIGDLLTYTPSGTKKSLAKPFYILSFIIGVIFLAKAYSNGISGKAWETLADMGITVSLGILGTILIFFGMRLFIDFMINLGSKRKLHTYNFRQVQELVIQRSTALAFCSLLILAALSLFGAGASISGFNSNKQMHILDYTFKNDNPAIARDIDANKVVNKLKEIGLESKFEKIIEVKIGRPKEKGKISIEDIVNVLKEQGDSENIEALIRNFEQYDGSFNLISLSAYNELRRAAKLNDIELKDNEALLYMGQNFVVDLDLMNKVVQKNPKVQIKGKTFKITEDVQILPLVTDREITLAIAFIVPDADFAKYTDGMYSSYVSGVLSQDIVQENGLMQAISATNEELNKYFIKYESYIQNIGRRLFFVVSTSYITIYLAIIFLVVANTIIGVQFLMGQRKSYKRYQTLIHLGATYDTLCKSANKQINWYFGLPIAIAFINSFFLFISLLKGFVLSISGDNILTVLAITIVIIFILGIVELFYIGSVKRNSRKYLLSF